MRSCDQELCPYWAGDSGCPCAVLGIERDGEEPAYDPYYETENDYQSEES